MLVSVSCLNAQAKSELHEMGNHTILVSVDDSSGVTIYQNYTILNLIELYSGYEDECWRDSTLVKWGRRP